METPQERKAAKQAAIRQFTMLIRAQRDLLKLSRKKLAKKAQVNVISIIKIEHDMADEVHPDSVVKVLEKLQSPEVKSEARNLMPAFMPFVPPPPRKPFVGRQLRQARRSF